MSIKRVPTNTIKIRNIDELLPESKAPNLNPNVPQHFSHTIICGQTGCGKTTVVANLLTNPDVMYWDELHLYYKTQGEDKYDFLRIYVEEYNAAMAEERQRIADELGVDVRDVKEPKYKYLYTAHDLNDVIPVETIMSIPDVRQRVKIIVFDDFVSEKNQSVIQDYYILSRKLRCSCYYLTQRMHDVPKVIRSNSANIIVFNQPKRELGEIYKSFGGVLDRDDFYYLFDLATAQDNGFLYIRTRSKPEDRYRVMFSDPVEIEIE